MDRVLKVSCTLILVTHSGFNLTLETGVTHALVGPSGCGKSTAVGLIERFYDAGEGEVSFTTPSFPTLRFPT